MSPKKEVLQKKERCALGTKRASRCFMYRERREVKTKRDSVARVRGASAQTVVKHGNELTGFTQLQSHDRDARSFDSSSFAMTVRKRCAD
jgi:hypothetical protein